MAKERSTEGGLVDVVCMDLRKAFDNAPKYRLISKIEAHGIKWSMDRKFTKR